MSDGIDKTNRSESKPDRQTKSFTKRPQTNSPIMYGNPVGILIESKFPAESGTVVMKYASIRALTIDGTSWPRSFRTVCLPSRLMEALLRRTKLIPLSLLRFISAYTNIIFDLWVEIITRSFNPYILKISRLQMFKFGHFSVDCTTRILRR